MATANLRIRVNGGALVSGTTVVAAEDEIALTATSFAGWQSARWWIVDFPADFPCPSGWSTDGSSGRYYYDMSAVDGIEPTALTMPTSAEISAGQWGKWLFDLTVNGSVTASVRCGVKIVSPNLGLNGLAFSEEAEFGGEQRAWVEDYNEDQRAVDDAALAVGAAPADAFFLVTTANGDLTNEIVIGSVSSTLAFASTSVVPLSSTRTDAATNSFVTAFQVGALSAGTATAGFGSAVLFRAEDSTNALGDIGKLAFGWTDITGSSEDSTLYIQTRTAGAALSAAASISKTQVVLGALAGVGTRYVTAAADGTLGSSAATGADATAAYLTDAATTVNANDVPIQDLPSTLTFFSDAATPVALHVEDSGTNTVIDTAALRRTTSGTAAAGIGGRLALQTEDAGGNTDVSGYISWRLTTATNGGEVSELGLWTKTGGGSLTKHAYLTGAGTWTATAIASDAIDTATATTGTLWASTATAGAIGKAATTVTLKDYLIVQKDAIGSADSNGLLLDNTTSSGSSEQRPPVIQQGGYGHKTGGGGSQVKCYATRRVRLVDGTSNPDIEVLEQYDLGGSVGVFGTWTTNLPGIAGTGLYLNSTLVLGGASNGVRGSGGGNPGLAFTGGWDVQVKAPSTDVVLQTNSTDRVRIANAGNQTYSLPATGIWRREFGTVATRYTDFASKVFTSDTAGGYETALSYTLPDNSTAVVIVWATAKDTTSGDAAGYGKRRTVKRFSAGAATTVGSERDLGADDEDDATWSLRTNVTGNTVYVEVEGDGTNAVKWGIDMEVHITLDAA